MSTAIPWRVRLFHYSYYFYFISDSSLIFNDIDFIVYRYCNTLRRKKERWKRSMGARLSRSTRPRKESGLKCRWVIATQCPHKLWWRGAAVPYHRRCGERWAVSLQPCPCPPSTEWVPGDGWAGVPPTGVIAWHLPRRVTVRAPLQRLYPRSP